MDTIKINDQNVTWMYRGEGNSNLVIAIPELKSVIRIMKTPNTRQIGQIMTFLDFLNEKLGPYANEINLVNISEEDTRKIEEKIVNLRAVVRLDKRLQAGDAMIMRDCSLLPHFDCTMPTFCVELKLKQGWIPMADRLTSKCSYCLKQALKVDKKLVKQPSNYCPLDIYSGDVTRMRTALEHLIDNPQNNFKLFKNGLVIFPNNTHINLPTLISPESSSKFFDLIIENLLKPHQSSMEDVSMSHLPKGSILHLLYSLQKLNELGVADAYRLYKKYESDKTRNCDMFSIKEFIVDPTDYCLIRNYLLFATVRDCSIMISYQGCVASVKLIDLDPKIFATIEKHWLQHANVLSLHNNISACSRKCNFIP